MAHALLSPSSAKRWLTCTPSARLESKYSGTTSEAAEEGTTAHGLAEIALKRYFFKDNEQFQENEHEFDWEEHNLKQSKYYNEDMQGYVDAYVEHCIETYAEAKRHCSEPIVFIEQRLDLTKYAPDSFGTADFVVVADHKLYMRDLKYGKGVKVEAEDNYQLKVYGLGALEAFGFLYDINYLNVGIYQPRIGNIAQFEIHVQDLERWGEEVLKPGAAMAYAGEGKLVAGSHCKFCKAAAKCRALADYNNASIHDDFAPPQELDDEEILSIVEKADEIRQWLKVMEEWVLSSALQGKQWEGFKLVAGRSNRKFSDEIEVVNRLKQAGYTEEDIYNKAVKGISILEKEMGKKRVAEILDGLIVKPKGSPTLAPVSDPRQEWNSAEADFSQQ